MKIQNIENIHRIYLTSNRFKEYGSNKLVTDCLAYSVHVENKFLKLKYEDTHTYQNSPAEGAGCANRIFRKCAEILDMPYDPFETYKDILKKFAIKDSFRVQSNEIDGFKMLETIMKEAEEAHYTNEERPIIILGKKPISKIPFKELYAAVMKTDFASRKKHWDDLKWD